MRLLLKAWCLAFGHVDGTPHAGGGADAWVKCARCRRVEYL